MQYNYPWNKCTIFNVLHINLHDKEKFKKFQRHAKFFNYGNSSCAKEFDCPKHETDLKKKLLHSDSDKNRGTSYLASFDSYHLYILSF